MNANRALIVMTVAGLLVSGCFGSSATTTPSPEWSVSPTASAAPTISPSASSIPSPSPSELATAVPTATPTRGATPSPPPPPTAQPTPFPTAFITYTVRSGDTLGTIAAAYRTTWGSLVYWNRTRYATLDPDSSSYNPNSLAIGWTLRLQPGVVVAYDAPISVAPTAAPTVAPAPAAGILVTNGIRGTSRVALTLDMGGRVGDAVAIMTWLRDRGVKATIFMTGAMADSTATDAGRLVLARIDARPDLFDLGNHTYTHPHMTTLTESQIADELRTTEAAIARHASSNPRPFFRPPFGEWNPAVVSAAASVGYRFSVMWDVDTIDWKPIADGGPRAQQIVDKVLARTQGGTIVLMHLGGYETLDALPGIVKGLRDRGFEFVTLGEMLGD